MSRIIEVPLAGNKLQGHAHAPLDDFEIVGTSNTDFFKAILNTPRPRLQYSSREAIYHVAQRSNRHYNPVMLPFASAPTTSLMVQALHGAFSGHRAISLRPDTVWYMIVHEVAEHVKKNSKKYGKLFGHAGGDEKHVLQITDFGLHNPQDKERWTKTIQNFVGKYLYTAVGDDVKRLFVPQFSTTTPEDRISMVVALADVASPYYDIRINSLCHIPEIRLEGEPDDWNSIVERVKEFSRVFSALGNYFRALMPILQTITTSLSARRLNMEFWRSIYKYDSASRTELITGWITAFLAHTQTANGATLRGSFGTATLGVNEFPSHVSTVPFIWEDGARERQMILLGGITGVDYADGRFLTPRLGYAVAEV